MKKITIVVQAKEADSTVAKLRSLGVLHIEHQQAPKGKEINELQEEISLVNYVNSILSEKEFVDSVIEPENIQKELGDWRFTAKHIIDLRKRLEQLDEYSRHILNDITKWENWGDFEPSQIEDLAKKNIYLKLYQIPVKEINNLPSEVSVKIIKIIAGAANCAVVSKGRIDIGQKEIVLPKMSLEKMRARIIEDKRVMGLIKQDIKRLTIYLQDFLSIKKLLESELEFHQAVKGMGGAGALSYLSGYAPFDKLEIVVSAVKKERWALVVKDPSEEDNPPVLLRNSKLISLINPVYKLMDVAPGYRELDVSPVFLLFLALFFGMIIGDAGYGAVYFGLTFLAQYKLGEKIKDKTPFFLFYLFSFCAIIWGLLTGTVFGQQWYLERGFNALAPALNNAKFIMAFCFLLGVIQLSLAHGWQVLVKFPSLTALADIGFICLLWAGFFLAKMFIVEDPFPYFGKLLIWAGIFLIMFFSNLQKNILKSAAQGLGVLALGIMGNFGDIVSYIRLFAVGLAGVAVSDSVNALAAGTGNIIAQTIILFIGHSINIILGPMSVLVHGIRLNVLEFSLLHCNVTWSGLAYKPLRE